MYLDKENLGKNIKVSTDNYPVVIFEDKSIGEALINFFKVKRKISDIFGKILSQFGYTKEDVILLKNISYGNNNVISFNYVVNGVEETKNKITLNFAHLVFNNLFVISDKDMSITLKTTVFNSKDVNLWVERVEEKIDNSRLYTRECYYDTAVYKIIVDDKEFVLVIKKDGDNLKEKCLLIEDEGGLENYLKSIQFPINIDTVYNGIVPFLGDINSYEDLKLTINSIKKDGSRRTTDLLYLNRGICEAFMMTCGEMNVSLMADGSWIYKSNNEDSRIFYLEKDGEITYTIGVSGDESLKEFVNEHAVNSVNEVVGKVNNTKKLVRELVGRHR